MLGTRFTELVQIMRKGALNLDVEIMTDSGVVLWPHVKLVAEVKIGTGSPLLACEI
jgi:hypothetical protein